MINFLTISIVIFSPLLSIWCAGPVFALIVLASYFIPVGTQDSTSACLITLDHSFSGLWICFCVNFLKKAVKSFISLWFFSFEFFVDIFVNFVPVLGSFLWATWVRRWLSLCLWNACGHQSTFFSFSQGHPVLVCGFLSKLDLNLFGHHLVRASCRIAFIWKLDLANFIFALLYRKIIALNIDICIFNSRGCFESDKGMSHVLVPIILSVNGCLHWNLNWFWRLHISGIIDSSSLVAQF